MEIKNTKEYKQKLFTTLKAKHSAEMKSEIQRFEKTIQRLVLKPEASIRDRSKNSNKVDTTQSWNADKMQSKNHAKLFSKRSDRPSNEKTIRENHPPALNIISKPSKTNQQQIKSPKRSQKSPIRDSSISKFSDKKQRSNDHVFTSPKRSETQLTSPKPPQRLEEFSSDKCNSSRSQNQHSRNKEKQWNMYSTSTSDPSEIEEREESPFKDLSFFGGSWQLWEQHNLEDLNSCSWEKSAVYLHDITLPLVERSFANGGIIPSDLHPSDARFTDVYLLLREALPSKPVMGLAKVLEHRDESLRVEYLCLSRPGYVRSPWCDEQLFTHTQRFQLKEDVRILIDEYRMSLRNNKIVPLFPNRYPWTACTAKGNAECLPPVAARSTRDQPIHSTSNREVNSSPVNAPSMPSIRQPQQPIYQPITNNRVRNIIPPLRGLKSKGVVKAENWYDIEIANLSCLAQNRSNEYFVCDTNINAIRKSFSTRSLKISEQNMVNIVTSMNRRSEKLLILRASFPEMYVVGLAHVPMTSQMVRTEQGLDAGCISYAALSTSPVKLDRLSQYYDGSAVESALFSSYLQQHVLALKDGQYKPLITDVYPWCSTLPGCLLKIRNKKTDNHASSNKPISCGVVDLPSGFDKSSFDYYDSEPSSISFADIEAEIGRINGDATTPQVSAAGSFEPDLRRKPVGRGRGAVLRQQVKQFR